VQAPSEDLEKGVNELRKSDADLRATIDFVPELAWCNRADGCIEFTNRRWHDYTGLSSQEAHGSGWKAAIHPEDLVGLIEKWDALRDLDKPGQFQVRLRRSDGIYRWFLLRRQPLRDSTGSVVRWYATAVDIENRKQTETLRVAEKQTLEMIADNASLKDILNHLCTCIDVQVWPSVTTVLLMDPDGTRLWQSAGPLIPPGWIPVINPVPVALDAGLCGTAAFLKTRVIVNDVATEQNWHDEYRDVAIRNGIRAAWSAPILTNDNRVLGTFALYCPEPCVPTEADLALIEGAGRIARIAIERQRSQEDLRRALDEIQKSEAKRQAVAQQVPSEIVTKWQEIVNLLAEIMHVPAALVMQVEPPNIKVFVSSESARNPYEQGELASLSTGLYCETVMKTRQPLLVPDAVDDEEWKSNPDIKLGMISYFGLPIVWPNGDIFGTICVLDNKKNDHGELHKKLLSQFRDLIQEDLRWLTDIAIHQIVDVIPVMIGVVKPDGTLLSVNKTVLDYTGFSIDDAKQQETRGIHPEDIERIREERRNAMLGNKPFAFEERIRCKDGQYRWFLTKFNPLLDEHGRVIRWYATGTDIHDRVKAEERIRNENLALREQIDRDSMFEDIVGSSEVLRKVLRQVTKVALSDSTVLILGETGTGKELIARAIHKRSKRASRAFIGVNCAAIPPSLIASELFGYEKGAFTGATQRRLGRFESASGGTLFLDEVGDLPLDIQIALLRVLQEREIQRVGGNTAISVDVRVLAATHRDLDVLVAQGKFREDLLYRLNVVPIVVPSLRERADDLPLLVEYFITRFGKNAGKKFRAIDDKTLNLFRAYGWPGNVRELQNVIERAVILSEGDICVVDETWLKRPSSHTATSPAFALSGVLHKREKEMIEAALAASNGRVSGPTGAAAKLGIPTKTLDSKIKRLGINKYQFRAYGTEPVA
jgi:PAS domain S-box-containing protein